jgi:hypothetical protein
MHTEESTMTQRTSPAKGTPPVASGTDDPRRTSQESGHDEKRTHEHPKSDRSTRNTSADTLVDEGRRNDGEGSIESVNGSDEDSRSRRRDLGR